MAEEGGEAREVGVEEEGLDMLPLPLPTGVRLPLPLPTEVKVVVGWAVLVPEGDSVGVGATGVKHLAPFHSIPFPHTTFKLTMGTHPAPPPPPPPIIQFTPFKCAAEEEGEEMGGWVFKGGHQVVPLPALPHGTTPVASPLLLLFPLLLLLPFPEKKVAAATG